MHDVISAFLDNEPFDGQELSAALATPEGRDLLLDLIAMRAVMNPVEAAAAPAIQTKRPFRWVWASAAAALIALGTGYQLGRTVDHGAALQDPGAATIIAPEPTSVLTFEPGVNWTEATRAGGN